jgi:hypothetical protein
MTAQAEGDIKRYSDVKRSTLIVSMNYASDGSSKGRCSHCKKSMSVINVSHMKGADMFPVLV